MGALDPLVILHLVGRAERRVRPIGKGGITVGGMLRLSKLPLENQRQQFRQRCQPTAEGKADKVLAALFAVVEKLLDS